MGETSIDHLHISHNASGLEANIRVLVTLRNKQSMFTLKIFYFRYRFMDGNTCGSKASLVCKIDYAND